MSQIDETQPGSDVDDRSTDHDSISEGDAGGGQDDWLDTGYNPPDREPRTHIPTQAEEERGESLDTLLAAEEPDVWVEEETNLFDESGNEVGGSRSGRLVDAGSDGIIDTESDLVAEDVGIDGAAASSEEAAMHVIDEYDQR
jgi:hypothetical protein